MKTKNVETLDDLNVKIFQEIKKLKKAILNRSPSPWDISEILPTSSANVESTSFYIKDKDSTYPRLEVIKTKEG